MTENFRAMLLRMWEVMQQQTLDILPKILAGLLVLLIGLLIARVTRAFTARFFLAIRLDRISDRLGISAFLARGDIRHTFAEILATLVYWLVLLFSFQILGVTLGLGGVAHFFAQILVYIRHFIVALVIFSIGAGMGFFFGGAVQVAASNAGFPAAKPLGAAVKILISFFALVMALEELQIGTQLLISTMQIIIAAVALALALAFGFGCKDLAGNAVKNWMNKSRLQQMSERAEAESPGSAYNVDKRATAADN